MTTITTWMQARPLTAAAVSILAVGALVLLLRPLRKTPAAVAVASLAAMACTAYSADTSWRFAEHRLGMTSEIERAAMFAAAELALFSCALMARQNLRSPQGTPGTPGVLVWVITGVQVIPAYSESGIVGGTVRAVVGPVLAALLWHLAMGIELRHTTPGAASQSLPALVARELRERLLSRLGLAVRDRTAEQITRDRWTVKAVGLAAKLADMKPGARGRARTARRLSKAVGKAQAGADEAQRAKLLDLLAARRHAEALATIDLPSPWQDTTEDAQDGEDAPASVSVPPFPAPVPPGVRMLPIVARPAVQKVDPQDAEDAPEDDEDGADGPPPKPPLMTSKDVADHYGIKQSTVRNWVGAGRIPVHSKDASGRNLFHPDQLPNFHVGVPA
ncbi:helix-turn-helix domain-containing protein [Streptomyces paradoxus]|uniref:helix-turn-helix domain-containing protein n=1 Tax=Streptomyces paradoxus TaxID=66375 RepID=UPI003808D8E3